MDGWMDGWMVRSIVRSMDSSMNEWIGCNSSTDGSYLHEL